MQAGGMLNPNPRTTSVLYRIPELAGQCLARRLPGAFGGNDPIAGTGCKDQEKNEGKAKMGNCDVKFEIKKWERQI